MRKIEVDFSNTLNSVQKEQVEKILDNRLQVLSLSSKDEFIWWISIRCKDDDMSIYKPTIRD